MNYGRLEMEATLSECILPKAESNLGLKSINKELGKLEISQQKLCGVQSMPSPAAQGLRTRAHCVEQCSMHGILPIPHLSWSNIRHCFRSWVIGSAGSDSANAGPCWPRPTARRRMHHLDRRRVASHSPQWILMYRVPTPRG